MKLFAKSGAVAGAVLGLMVATVLLAPSAGTVEARPPYKKAFEKKYPKVKKVDCNVCHVGEDKKERNEYGKAMGEALGATKVTDAKKIEKALGAAEKHKDADGNPYGDKLKKGEKPTD
jgi:ssDNA-binding Zn-finger/Zn-ribbon topoisomerase 1